MKNESLVLLILKFQFLIFTKEKKYYAVLLAVIVWPLTIDRCSANGRWLRHHIPVNRCKTIGWCSKSATSGPLYTKH